MDGKVTIVYNLDLNLSYPSRLNWFVVITGNEMMSVIVLIFIVNLS